MLKNLEMRLKCERSSEADFPSEVSLVGSLILEVLIVVHQNADSQDRLSPER